MAGARNPLKGIIFWTVGVLAMLTVIFLAAAGVFLAMFDADRYKPDAIAWVKSHKDRTLAIEGPIELKVFPTLSLSLRGVSLSERGRPEVFARVAEADLSVRLVPLVQGRIEVGQVKARGVSLVYERRADGTRNIDDLLGGKTPESAQDAGDTDTEPEGLADIDIAGIDLGDVALSVHDEKAKVAGRLTLERFKAGRIAPGVETPIDVAAAAQLTQPAAEGRLGVKASVRYARPEAPGAAGTLTVTGLALDFEGASAGRTATTRLEADAAQFTGDTVRTSPLTLALSLGGAMPMALKARSGSVEGTREQLRVPGLVLDLTLGPQSMALTGDVEIASPVVAWSLTGDLKGPGMAGPVASTGRYSRADGALDAKVQMAAFAYDAIRLSDVRATLQGNGQRVDVSPFYARVWGGQVQGSGSYVPAAQRVTLAAAARGIRIEQALRDLAHRENLRGAGNVDVALQAHGDTVDQMKRTLAGTAKFALRDGAVKGFNLAQLGRQAKSALGLAKDETKKTDAQQETDFSSVDASFTIQNGVARGSDLDGRSPYLRVSGEGAIDLVASSIDYTVYATVTDTSKGQGGAELAALDGVKVPVRLTGPLSGMNYQVQWSAVGTALARQVVKTKLDEATQDKLRDKLRDKLKGLIR